MADLVKLAITLAFIVLLLRRKLKVPLALFLGSALLAAMYIMPPARIWGAVVATVTEPVTVKLVLALALIRMFEIMLREHDTMKRMMEAFKGIFHSRRAVIVSMPLLIGMLPSVGGAYFSAPMVGEATSGTTMPEDEKAFVNYWFRHPWEMVLPLYPGILLASALGGVKLRSLMLANSTYAVLMILIGFAFSMRGLPHGHARGPVTAAGLRSFAPVAAILLLVIALGQQLYVSLAAVIVPLFFIYRYKARDAVRIVRYGLSAEVVTLILSVMFLKSVMQATGAVEGISHFFTEEGVPLLPTVMLLPFITGALTGLTIGFVGATFPLIVSFPGGGTLAVLSLAFASGFAGVLLSPVHVCLILTREYFCAPMGAMYRRMALPIAIILAAALIQYELLSRL